MKQRAYIAALAWAAALAMPVCAAEEAKPALHTLEHVRVFPQGAVTRIIAETDGEVRFLSGALHRPERLYFDLRDTVTPTKRLKVIAVDSGVARQLRVALTKRNMTRIVVDLGEAAEFETSELTNPTRLVIEIRRKGAPKTKFVPEPELPAVSLLRSNESKRHLKKFMMPPERPLPVTPLITAPLVAVAKPTREEWLASLEAPIWKMPRVLPPARNKKSTAVASTRSKEVAGPPAPVRVEAGPPKAGRTAVAKAETQRTTVEELNAGVRLTPGDSMAEPARSSDTLTRALGLKLRRVVLDAGHGGKDTGTISPHGLYEKDLVLDVAQRLGKLIEERLGSEVVYTRDDDTFIPLQERTVIANREKADLFLSIHANSSRAESASGFETYYLNFSPSKADMDVAARENASSARTIADLNDLVKQIAMNEKLDESRQFAARVQESTYSLSVKTSGKTRNRGVKKAPFVVLIGARMPSVLVEIGFLTNSNEETQMKKAEYRDKIAEALFKGVSGYADTLSHFNVASAGLASAVAEGN